MRTGFGLRAKLCLSFLFLLCPPVALSLFGLGLGVDATLSVRALLGWLWGSVVLEILIAVMVFHWVIKAVVPRLGGSRHVKQANAELEVAQSVGKPVQSRDDGGRAYTEELAQTPLLRDALTQEVHHRIKNNLQAVVGLLRRNALKQPQAQAAIDAAVSQVQAVAVVHGLYGQVTRHSVMLCELLPVIVNSVSSLTGVMISLRGLQCAQGRLLIKENETVAIALILNELLTNAVKHSSVTGEAAVVDVNFVREGERACITITNRGCLPPGFKFGEGVGAGMGLGLVSALRPNPGVDLGFKQKGDTVEVSLVIGPPVVRMLEGLPQ